MDQTMEHDGARQPSREELEKQHPIGPYLKVWLLLFVLSTMSYMVDYWNLQGMLRWTLIIIFMLLKAGYIIAIFMHVWWERMALITAILGPPAVLLLLIGMMTAEGDYVFSTRVDHLGQPAAAERIHVADVLGEHHGESGGASGSTGATGSTGEEH